MFHLFKKKKKPSPFDLQPELDKSRIPEKTSPPIIVSAGLVVGWLTWRLFTIIQVCQDKGLSVVENLLPENIWYNNTFPPSIDKESITAGIICGIITCLMLIVANDKKKKQRKGTEHGSAKYFSKDASKPFRDENYFNNLIFSENELFSINDGISQRNRNILMLGSPGTGKSRFVYKPNLLQKINDETIFISDPKGELLRDCGFALKDGGFDIKVLNLAEPKLSDHFNVFEYIPYKNIETGEVKRHLTPEEFQSRLWEPESAEAMTLIDGIMKNTSAGEAKPSGDPFWDNCTQLELAALFFYVLCNLPLHRQNFGELMNISRMADASKKGIDNPLNRLFAEWELGAYWVNAQTNRPIKAGTPLYMALTDEEKEQYTIDSEGYVHKKKWTNEWGVEMTPQPEAFGVKQWKSLVVGAGSEKTMATVLLCMQSRLNLIDVPEMTEVLKEDEFGLDDLGFEKVGRKAYFIVSSPSRQAFMWFGALFYTLAFQMVEDNAKKQNGRNKVPINFFLDELANIGTIPNLIKQMTLVRGYNCGVFAGLQSLTQLKNMYKDEWEVFLDACNYILFLGSSSKETLEYISSTIGNETIYAGSENIGKAVKGGNGTNVSPSQRALITPDELRTMPKGYCLLLDNGVKVEQGTVYYSKLYNLKQHPRAHLLYEPSFAGVESDGKNYYDHTQDQHRMSGSEKYFKALGMNTDEMEMSYTMYIPFEELEKLDENLFMTSEEVLEDPDIAKTLNELKKKYAH